MCRLAGQVHRTARRHPGAIQSRKEAGFTAMGVNSTLTGRVAGQPALHGPLVKIRDLVLPLVWVNSVKPNRGEVPEQLI